jgi:hypothetical protein
MLGREIPSSIPAVLVAASLACVAGTAAAQEPSAAQEPPAAAPAPARDVVEAPPADTQRPRLDRTWLYLDDAKIPAPLKVIGIFNASFTQTGSPTRVGSPPYNALASNIGQPGGMIGVGGEIGLFSHVSIMTVVDITAGGEGPSPSAGLIAGVRVQAFPSRWRDSHLVLSAGYLREAWQGAIYHPDDGTSTPAKPFGDSGAWAQAAFSQDISRVRLAATVHIEHIFVSGRDPVDLMVQAGASARIIGGFRLGAEYVGQDLEEAGGDTGAEGGPRHFLGPVASLQILDDRLSLVAGPSFGLSARSPELLGRAGAAFAF